MAEEEVVDGQGSGDPGIIKDNVSQFEAVVSDALLEYSFDPDELW